MLKYLEVNQKLLTFVENISLTFKKMKINRIETAKKLNSIAKQLSDLALNILTDDCEDYDINCSVGGARARLENLSNKLQQTIDTEKIK